MDEIQSVPLVAYESMSSRLYRIIRILAIGWAMTAVALGLIIVISLSYSEEAYTETVSNDVEQEADDYGSNMFAGGDYYGSQTESSADGNTDNGDAA